MNIEGYVTEQKAVTVVNSDVTINAAITTQAEDNWLVSLLILSGSNVLILFTRTIAAA